MALGNIAPRSKLSSVAASLALASLLATGCAANVGDLSVFRDDSGGGVGTGTGTAYYPDDPCGGAMGGGSAQGGGILPPASDAERAIAEADVVQIVGDRLYALSAASGLSLIDVSVRDQLVLLDQEATAGYPLEMYADGATVHVLVDHGIDQHFSEVLSFGVANGSDLQLRDSLELPGHLSDSRRVGDVLYLVSYETHDCVDCPNRPTTTITSVNVAHSAVLLQIDELQYQQSYVDDLGWKRSVTVTPERMYVAGVEWDGVSTDGHSTIQVVDISDPTGDLVEGASVAAAGQILNRWQMDEHEGVLRVLSQPGVWATDAVPTVQTFSVVSSQQLVPLGSMDLTLPTPESLRTVRFDGDRVYAITAQPAEPYDPTPGAEVEAPPPLDGCGYMCDPLFVIDLSDPSSPVQLGSLEMPGWVFHIEPRGTKLYALGFEATYPLGLLSVSLFDVEDMTQPELLSRVTFGGEWSGLSEDQNRIHKSFSVREDLGLILVPYGWWQWQEEFVCGGECGDCWDDGYWYRQGAVQLIDIGADELLARGAAYMASWARRARIHDTRLLAVSEDEVASFDIGNRDQPLQTSALDL
ncbi:MAG: beta-propeller domain-containing protein [Deltaproteobacteria bacterium]|jgi:hypothetical protein|nr:beta-propeller domain-containing protein [Deltaproteobacteria bacterium]MBW2530280.1 beta-propeller domain-containing protein [Deltaproteobacteria bacterium]